MLQRSNPTLSYISRCWWRRHWGQWGQGWGSTWLRMPYEWRWFGLSTILQGVGVCDKVLWVETSPSPTWLVRRQALLLFWWVGEAVLKLRVGSSLHGKLEREINCPVGPQACFNTAGLAGPPRQTFSSKTSICATASALVVQHLCGQLL